MEFLLQLLKKTPNIPEKISSNRDLANKMKLHIGNIGENVVNFGDEGDTFYIILLGIVAIKIPNPAVKDWLLQWRKFQGLLAWKESVFDPKLKLAWGNFKGKES